MNTYTSVTGYIKRLETDEIFVGETIYLGIYDKAENYADVSKEDYEAYIKEQEEKMKEGRLYEESRDELR